MASQVNRDFFKKAKKVDRAIEIRDNEAVIPAVKERAEVRARLPNRRLLTIEERAAIIEERMGLITALDDEIEVERKDLLEKVKVYEMTKSGASDVVAQNLKVKSLMEKRTKLSHPEIWIETLPGLLLKDVFASKRDVRKIGADVFQVKRRLEPILSLYVDLETPPVQESSRPSVLATLGLASPSLEETVEPKTAAETAQGVIIGQKRVIKTKKASAAAPAGPVTFTI